MKDNEKRKNTVKNIGKMSTERVKARERERKREREKRVVYTCTSVYNV